MSDTFRLQSALGADQRPLPTVFTLLLKLVSLSVVAFAHG